MTSDESTISEPIHVSKKSRTQKGAAANMKHSVVSEVVEWCRCDLFIR